ncbi:MAG: Asd/ArgC dimerization domain-containing protein [Actinomycetia bacterium]|nr:Asd/ArgC dimerization domain-containing protein [Actinomycetes bacterium]
MSSTEDIRIGVIGATGAVGTVTLALLAERGYTSVRALASSRSAGGRISFGADELPVEETTAELLAAGDLDLCFFSVGTDTSRKLVPHALAGAAAVIDKSDAYRLADDVPLVVAGVNDEALAGAQAASSGQIVANPNCSAMQLACVLKPLHDTAGLTRVRLATYQSMSGKGDEGMEQLRATAPAEGDLALDWDLIDDEFSEEWKLRAETRKILDLPALLLSATCVRVPVMVGHAQAVWVETEAELSPPAARRALEAAPHVQLEGFPTPGRAAGHDCVLAGRIRRDPAAERGLVIWVVNDNLRKGAALNAVQIAEALIARNLIGAADRG